MHGDTSKNATLALCKGNQTTKPVFTVPLKRHLFRGSDNISRVTASVTATTYGRSSATTVTLVSAQAEVLANTASCINAKANVGSALPAKKLSKTVAIGRYT